MEDDERRRMMLPVQASCTGVGKVGLGGWSGPFNGTDEPSFDGDGDARAWYYYWEGPWLIYLCCYIYPTHVVTRIRHSL